MVSPTAAVSDQPSAGGVAGLMAYASGPAPEPLLAETIGAALRRTARAQPDREAVVSIEEGRRLSYRELDEHVDAVARGLLAADIQVGDRVALCAPNCLEWVLLQYAVARVGAVLVALNPAYRESELEYALGHSASRLLFVRAASANHQAMVEALGGRLEPLEDVVLLGALDRLIDGGRGVAPEALAEREAAFDFDALAAMQYTSGTTGVPKAATLTHHSILNNGLFGGQRMGYTGDERICVPVPLFHIFGTTFGTLAALAHGAMMVLPGARFDPGQVLAAVESERCTSLYGVPTMFLGILEHPERESFDLSSLRTGLAAGALCPAQMMRRLVEIMPEIGIGYGMTETAPCSLQTSVEDDLDRRLETVGTVCPHIEVKIVDVSTGRCARRGERGEICARGYSVMAGYWHDPERTAEAIDDRRWMHTGDLGVMDDDGYVRVVGRSKDIVIRGGENIDVREVEDLLFGHEAIAEAHVIGVPDERMGEELVAWVRLHEGASLDELHVQAYVRQRLAYFKVPRHVRFASEFPMTTSGKVQKFVLRERIMEELGLSSPS
jgi:fatty-acyl-CoA synthase